MYNPLDMSVGFRNLDLGKTANAVLLKCLGFMERTLGSTIKASLNHAAEAVLESSLKQLIPKEMTPEMSDYLSRVALRTLVGLPRIDINDRDDDAILRLKGSISWIGKKKVDVTEIIRDMRDG